MSGTDIEPHEKTKSDSDKQQSNDGAARMTFTSHLGELRTRMIKAAVAILICFGICYGFSNKIIDVMTSPLKSKETVIADNPDDSVPPGEEGLQNPSESTPAVSGETEQEDKELVWIVLTPLETILVKLKFSAYGAILLGFPFIAFQICAFVFPGLKPSERRLVNTLLVGCTTLAVTGALIAFFAVFPLVINYLMSYTPEFVETHLRLSDTMSIIFKGILGFAIAFQFPVVVLIVVYMGILEPKTLKANRRIAVVGLFVLAAMLTPPDPISLVIMAMPLVLLYEFSIWASVLIVRKKARIATE